MWPSASGLNDASAQVRVRIRTISGGTLGVSNYDYGQSVARIGDLDGNGVDELAAGCPFCEVAVIWFMASDGSVIREQVIRPPDNRRFEGFGISTAGPGDIDGDGVPDLVVGSESDPAGTGVEAGVIWVYLLSQSGSVRSQSSLTITAGRQEAARFGHSVAAIGDRNGDRISELVVGAPGIDSESGRVYLVSLNSAGRLSTIQPLGSGAVAGDRFGSSLSSIGDLDGDGVGEIAIGSAGSSGGRGLVTIAFMESGAGSWRLGPAIDASVLPLGAGDAFGTSVAGIGDVDGDGVPDIAAGAAGDDGAGEVGSDRGAVYRIFLRRDGSLKGYQRLSDDADGVFEQLSDGLRFGSAVGHLGDLDGDSVPELVVGTAPDIVEDPTPNNALWILFSLPLPLNARQNITVGPEQPVFGQPIAVRGRWGIGLNGATLFFRKPGDSDFLGSVMLESDADVYETEIPAFSVGQAGAEYYVTVVSSAGVETRVPEDGHLSIPVLLQQGVGMRAPHGRAASGFRLISFPLQLYEPDVLGALEDDLGPYDPVKWRLYGFGPTLIELGRAEMLFGPGRSFWLLTAESGLQIDSGPGVTVPTDTPFRVEVRPGWNLVANPFLVPLTARSLSLSSGGTIDPLEYEGDWSPIGDVLAPLEGLAVYSQASDTLIFDPTYQDRSAKASSSDDPPQWSWSVNIAATAAGARDLANVAAVHSEALDRQDVYDRAEPPTIGDFVSLYFSAPEIPSMSRLRTDVRPDDEAGYTWPFEIRTNTRAPVRLDFSLRQVPDGYEVWLVDDDTGVRQRVEQASSVTVAPYASEDRPRPLRLLVGGETYLRREAGRPDEAVAEFALDQNYPNPFNAFTSVGYRLAETTPVDIRIFDLLGREVVALVSETQAAGYHVAVWDGRDAGSRSLSSGVFIVRLQAGPFSATIRLMLVR